MYLDDLPVWGMVGEMLPGDGSLEKKEKNDLQRLDHVGDISDAQASDLKPYVYTARTLTISHNADQVVKVDLTSDPKSLEEVVEGAELTFSMLISWKETPDEFHSRFDRYLDHDFFKHPIHWFSVCNKTLHDGSLLDGSCCPDSVANSQERLRSVRIGP